MDDKTDKRIEQLKTKLEHLEDTDPLYMNEEMQYLRHKVLFIHARLEVNLDYLIIKGINNHLVQKTTKLENILTFRKTQTILGEIGFAKKIELAKKLHQLNNPLYGLVKSVNTVRNRFSHFVNYQDQINEYKKPAKYIETLELLVSTMDGLNKLFLKFLPIVKGI